jgi:hypothetical protein
VDPTGAAVLYHFTALNGREDERRTKEGGTDDRVVFFFCFFQQQKNCIFYFDRSE